MSGQSTSPLSIDPAVIKPFIKNYTSKFETWLLAVILTDAGFWEEHCKAKINHSSGKFRFYDFIKPVDNEIYKQINMFYNVGRSSATPVTQMSTMLLTGIFQSMFEEGKIAKDTWAFLKDRLTELDGEIGRSEVLQTQIRPLVESGLPYWLEYKHAAQLLHYYQKNPSDTQTIISQLQKSLDEGCCINAAEQQSFCDAMDFDVSEGDPDEANVVRMPIANMPLLTKVLGGGVRKGETALVIGASGAGKTVFAIQAATGLALNGFKTAYITTEQPGHELVPRCISCNTGIPFDLITDGIKTAIRDKKLTQSQIDQISEFRVSIGDNLRFENWCNSGSKLLTHLEPLIKRYMETTGLDALIIDWLGGGLDLSPQERERLHLFIAYVVDMLKNLARKYNIFILVMGQANKKKSAGKARLSVEDNDGSNTIDQPFTWAAGISSLQESATKQFNELQEAYKRRQYINLWKNRKQKPVSYPVYRDFEFQKFTEKEQSEIMDMPARSVTYPSVTVTPGPLPFEAGSEGMVHI